jgi:hypothetical protein
MDISLTSQQLAHFLQSVQLVILCQVREQPNILSSKKVCLLLMRHILTHLRHTGLEYPLLASKLSSKGLELINRPLSIRFL